MSRVRAEGRAYWRANWLVTPLEPLSPLLMEDTERPSVRQEGEELAGASLLDLAGLQMSQLGLRTEYQTIFSLPRSGCVVFSIHSYISPLTGMDRSPRAADMISRATKQMGPDTLQYRGLSAQTRDNIVHHCDSLVAGIWEYQRM